MVEILRYELQREPLLKCIDGLAQPGVSTISNNDFIVKHY